ncbi:FKBP-type peptidyl-prolyl cis-trans isomerase N-terminal domain-containing protein [Corallococcus exercitus]|uniref:Peptidyl-prolyl cis-trans isomerase FKBP-type N-terminal domain-containing protein n=1 Tax=Corallococcus exercitus TaxID=2316736 RepID=A0A7Y4JN39_9BACT|nr:FKBP-type peptidyl-prolyl cis-trans isomerase N-terminal domain-containing protein [Corallococcus exercitus]NOK08038.1 hypothetical protein [Corallococcus exercitus]
MRELAVTTLLVLALEGKPSLLSGPELTQPRTRAQGSMLQNRTAKRAADSAKYGAAGQSFLATNKAQKGVVTASCVR